jgi:hypothetical protein
MPIVKVNVKGIDTCALLDTGSSNRFCSKALIDALGIKDKDDCYKLSTLNHVAEHNNSKLVDLKVCSSDGQRSVNMKNVYVVDKIPVHCNNAKFCEFEHLKDLPLCNSHHVNILIGQDNSSLLMPLEVRRNKGIMLLKHYWVGHSMVLLGHKMQVNMSLSFY